MTHRAGSGHPEDDESGLPVALALGVGFGTAVGALIFAITGNALWIALAPGFGVSLGLLYHVISKET